MDEENFYIFHISCQNPVSHYLLQLGNLHDMRLIKYPINTTRMSLKIYKYLKKYNIFSKKIIVHDELIVVIQGLRKSNNIKNKQVKNIFMKLLNIPIELKILVSEYLMYDFYDGY